MGTAVSNTHSREQLAAARAPVGEAEAPPDGGAEGEAASPGVGGPLSPLRRRGCVQGPPVRSAGCCGRLRPWPQRSPPWSSAVSGPGHPAHGSLPAAWRPLSRPRGTASRPAPARRRRPSLFQGRALADAGLQVGPVGSSEAWRKWEDRTPPALPPTCSSRGARLPPREPPLKQGRPCSRDGDFGRPHKLAAGHQRDVLWEGVPTFGLKSPTLLSCAW